MNVFDGCSGGKLANGLKWLNPPQTWSFDDRGLKVVPDPETDFFRPYNREARDDACFLYRSVQGNFTATARISVKLAGFGDAAAVTVRADAENWAKLCIERSPAGEMNAVSVVTNRWSDDATGELVSKPECWLRLSRNGNVFGMHYSLDGSLWRFVRSFALRLPEKVGVGVHAQAPFGSGCEALFHTFTLTDRYVADFRSGD
jgi:regulation of enolase protein 1 (concanavalin A-like superfamily)